MPNIENTETQILGLNRAIARANWRMLFWQKRATTNLRALKKALTAAKAKDLDAVVAILESSINK